MDFPKAILFDLDGVLINTEPLLAEAWKETTKEFQFKLSNNNLQELKGRRRIDCAKKIQKWMNKGIKIEELLITQKLKINDQIWKAKPFKGAEDLINFCINTKLPIALVTSSSSQSFKLKSNSNPWLNLFKVKIFGDDKYIKSGKPEPYPYLRALEKLGVSPNKTWVIEDSYAGSLAGLRAKCNLWFFSKDLETLNKLRNEFNLQKIERINELSEIIYYLKLWNGFKT